MVLLYLTSTLYHAVPRGRVKTIFQRLDHCAIFLLIAGTYTPFTLGVLRGGIGWALFGLVWGLAATGIVLNLDSSILRAPRTSRQVLMQGGEPISAQAYLRYVEHEIGEANAAEGPESAAECRRIAESRLKAVVGPHRHPRLSVALYLTMGWLIIAAARPLWLHLPHWGLFWLVAGGLAYTAGVAFYAASRLRYGHFVWHLFVLAGTACHFVAVWRYAA